MSRQERERMLYRYGLYSGAAVRYLDDSSYAAAIIGHAQDLTEEMYRVNVVAIHVRLVQGGFLQPEQDVLELFRDRPAE